MSYAQPVHLWWADERLSNGVSATQSDFLDLCLFNDHPAVSMPNTEMEKQMTEDLLSVAHQEYMEKIRELHERLNMVKKMVRPGCSHEVLNTALSGLSSLAKILSKMPQKLHASL